MDHLPFVSTPVTSLPYFSRKLGCNLICKRDDLFLEAGGGSKARMLQYILAEVNKDNCDVLVTAGGPCSNFNRACALMCAKLGVNMHLVEYTDNPQEWNSQNYYICKLAGIKTTRCKKSMVPETINSVIHEHEQSGEKVKYVYGGGKSVQGIYAYYDAVKELRTQIDTVDHIFVACGTGTTLTGICAAVQAFYPNAIVHAVSTARSYENEVQVLTEDMCLLNNYLNTNHDFKNLKFYADYLCGGYGQYNKQLSDCIKECITHEGMIIDPTYSGKAFWGMSDVIQSQKTYFCDKTILFWNTGGVFNLLSENLSL